MNERDRELFKDLVSKAKEALEYLDVMSERAYGKDRKMQLIIGHLLIQIGETANRLSDDARHEVKHDWRALSGFRNILVHQYEGLDHGQVYHTVMKRMPELIRTIETHLGRK